MLHNIFDFFKALGRRGFSSGLLQVKLQIFDAPFASVFCVKIALLLLDGVVCKMDHHVVHITKIGTVILCTESGES